MRLWILLLAAALAGCGSVMRIAYNNGDLALRTMAYEYFDLQGEQQDLLKSQLARFHDWHRREELPAYAEMLQGAADRLARGLARADVIWAIVAVRARYRSVVAQAAEEGAPVLARLEPDNYAALEKKLADANRKFASEYLTGDQAKRDRARAKWLEERVGFFVGDLTDAQRALIARFVESQPRMSEVRLDERMRRQQEFVRLVKGYRSSPDLAGRLRSYLLDWDRGRGPEHARLARDWEDRLVALALDIDRTLTPDQRQRAVQRFRSLAEDCRVLAEQGQPGGSTASLAVGAATRPPRLGFE
jgi:hypothetical protein